MIKIRNEEYLVQKRIPLLFMMLLLCTITYAQVETSQVNLLTNDCEKKVKETNNQILYKTLLDYGGYRVGPEDASNEWLSVLYFNKEGTLKKSKLIYNSGGDIGYYVRYYGKKGEAMRSCFCAYPGMNGSYSAIRYLNEDGYLISLDFISRDPEGQGDVVEHIIKRGGYDASMPLIDGAIYDKVMNIADLRAEIKYIYDYDNLKKGIDNLQKPEETIAVKFVKPQKEDKTIINGNSVNLRKDASTTYNHIHKLNVGDEVTILEVEGNWYKVEFHNRYGDNKIGYVLGDFLEPVEREVK